MLPRVQEEWGRKVGLKKTFEEVITENLPDLAQVINLNIQEAG